MGVAARHRHLAKLCVKMSPFLVVVVLFCTLTTATAALGPDNIFVIAAGDDADSVNLATQYQTLRSIPANRLCTVTGIGGPTWPADALSYAQYADAFFPQVEACVERSGAAAELVAFVLMRGLPRRVYGRTPSNTTASRLSLAAMLSLWRSTCVGGAGAGNNCDRAAAGAPLFAQRNYDPLRAWPHAYQRWRSPFYFDEPTIQALPGPSTQSFGPGFSRVLNKTKWVPALVTALDGYSYTDALRLVRSALAAEAAGPASWLAAGARFVLMHGPSPTGPREELSFQYKYVAGQTRALLAASFPHAGFNGTRQVLDAPFATNERFGGPVAAFFVGTAALNTTVESNTFVNGSLVDNLTSFGCMPCNFNATATSMQVAVSRWIQKGVAGVHGTTDEPNDGTAFPDRMMLLDYVRGASLAEAYLQRIPYAGWRNYVVGDALAQVYCPRPAVALRWDAAAAAVEAEVSGPLGASFAADGFRVGAFADGVRVAGVRRVDGAALRWTVDVSDVKPGGVSMLVVAEVRYASGGRGVAHCAVPVKGWTALRVG